MKDTVHMASLSEDKLHQHEIHVYKDVKVLTCNEEMDSDEGSTKASGKKKLSEDGDNPSHKKIKLSKPEKNDYFCWLCHEEGATRSCSACPRSFHNICLSSETTEVSPKKMWICTECSKILSAEEIDSRSSSKFPLKVEELCTLLSFVVKKMKQNAVPSLLKPVPTKYTMDHLVNPFDLNSLEKKVQSLAYGSLEAFLADAQWIFHNSIILNGFGHKLTSTADYMMRLCQGEVDEIRICSDCYRSMYSAENWFSEPCRRPHILVWAKLRGFPFWPGKAVQVVDDTVDVRFFGAHDRAWVPLNQCFLYSKEAPTEVKKSKRKGTFQNALDEVETYKEKFIKAFGSFEYAEPKVILKESDVEEYKKKEKDYKYVPPPVSQTATANKEVKVVLPVPVKTEEDYNQSVLSIKSDIIREERLRKIMVKKNEVNIKKEVLDNKEIVKREAPPGVFEESLPWNDDFSGELKLQISKEDLQDVPKKINNNLKDLQDTLKKLQCHLTSEDQTEQANSQTDQDESSASPSESKKENENSEDNNVDKTSSSSAELFLGESSSKPLDDPYRCKLASVIQACQKYLSVSTEKKEPETSERGKESSSSEDDESEDDSMSTDDENGSCSSSGSGENNTEKSDEDQENSETSDEKIAKVDGKSSPDNSQKSSTKKEGKLTGEGTPAEILSQIEEMLKVAPADKVTAFLKSADLKMDAIEKECKEELIEFQHIAALTFAEMQLCAILEKKKSLALANKQFQQEQENTIKEIKKKRWCVVCEKEAVLHCCIKASYCSVLCRQSDFSKHRSICVQTGHATSTTAALPRSTVVTDGSFIRLPPHPRASSSAGGNVSQNMQSVLRMPCIPQRIPNPSGMPNYAIRTIRPNK